MAESVLLQPHLRKSKQKITMRACRIGLLSAANQDSHEIDKIAEEQGRKLVFWLWLAIKN
jgi:hypothetical protein